MPVGSRRTDGPGEGEQTLSASVEEVLGMTVAGSIFQHCALWRYRLSREFRYLTAALWEAQQ